jgi:hypothetical protein
MKKKIRPLGSILLDLEIILDEMIDSHELQEGDLYGLIFSHIDIHRPDIKEKYVDGGSPFRYYGSIEGLQTILNRSKK